MSKSSLQIIVALGACVALAIGLFAMQGRGVLRGQATNDFYNGLSTSNDTGMDTVTRTLPGMPSPGTTGENFMVPPIEGLTGTNPVDPGLDQPLGNPTDTTASVPPIPPEFLNKEGYCCRGAGLACEASEQNGVNGEGPMTYGTCCGAGNFIFSDQLDANNQPIIEQTTNAAGQTVITHKKIVECANSGIRFVAADEGTKDNCDAMCGGLEEKFYCSGTYQCMRALGQNDGEIDGQIPTDARGRYDSESECTTACNSPQTVVNGYCCDTSNYTCPETPRTFPNAAARTAAGCAPTPLQCQQGIPHELSACVAGYVPPKIAYCCSPSQRDPTLSICSRQTFTHQDLQALSDQLPPNCSEDRTVCEALPACRASNSSSQRRMGYCCENNFCSSDREEGSCRRWFAYGGDCEAACRPAAVPGYCCNAPGTPPGTCSQVDFGTVAQRNTANCAPSMTECRNGDGAARPACTSTYVPPIYGYCCRQQTQGGGIGCVFDASFQTEQQRIDAGCTVDVTRCEQGDPANRIPACLANPVIVKKVCCYRPQGATPYCSILPPEQQTEGCQDVGVEDLNLTGLPSEVASSIEEDAMSACQGRCTTTPGTITQYSLASSTWRCVQQGTDAAPRCRQDVNQTLVQSIGCGVFGSWLFGQQCITYPNLAGCTGACNAVLASTPFRDTGYSCQSGCDTPVSIPWYSRWLCNIFGCSSYQPNETLCRLRCPPVTPNTCRCGNCSTCTSANAECVAVSGWFSTSYVDAPPPICPSASAGLWCIERTPPADPTERCGQESLATVGANCVTRTYFQNDGECEAWAATQ